MIDILEKEAFYYALQLISHLGVLEINPYSVHLEFRLEVYEGNVYTGLRSYVNDFGYEGLIVLPVVYSVCKLALLRSSTRITAAGLMLYAMLIYPIFADFIRCFFFLSFFNLNNIITVIGLIFLRRLLLSLHWMRYRSM